LLEEDSPCQSAHEKVPGLRTKTLVAASSQENPVLKTAKKIKEEWL
jgi:hypothetical protein